MQPAKMARMLSTLVQVWAKEGPPTVETVLDLVILTAKERHRLESELRLLLEETPLPNLQQLFTVILANIRVLRRAAATHHASRPMIDPTVNVDQVLGEIRSIQPDDPKRQSKMQALLDRLVGQVFTESIAVTWRDKNSELGLGLTCVYCRQPSNVGWAASPNKETGSSQSRRLCSPYAQRR